ncbi:MAG: HEAT repeat domain-containing protein [Candidatus Nealsonbacteria bacterium]|nr:HEAT repeat domain-containing protein [Candidatus Nealsonbacteria bacterium]
MAVSERLKVLVGEMPAADERGMLTTDIDKDRIEKAVVEIHGGGRANVLGLIEMLDEPGTEADVKPHYALHCVVNHSLVTKDENARRQIAETMAEQLDGELSTYNKVFLCQELQWSGRKEAVAALGKLLTDEELTESASMALVAIRDGAVEQFRAALPAATGKCRLNVVDGLAALADGQSAGAFRQALGDKDREVRLAAGAGLAAVGDASAADALLGATNVEPGWERVRTIKHCLVLAENLAAAGKRVDAAKIYSRLRDGCKAPEEKYLRDAAEKGLAAATST